MIVLGIDQASATGWAVVTEGEIRASGTEKFKGTRGKKYSEFASWFRTKLMEHNPDAVYCEAPHFRGYAATMIGVGMVAIMNQICYEMGVPIEEVHSQTLKKFATGRGFKVSKDAMTKAASELIGKKLTTKEDNNEADAIHLAYYGDENFGKS